MFKRIIPNLKRIGLLSSKVKKHYESIGLLMYKYDSGKDAPDLTFEDLLKPDKAIDYY